jgi:hypothetical protein
MKETATRFFICNICLLKLFGFICFGAEAHHIPIIVFVVVLINGATYNTPCSGHVSDI